QLDGLPGIRNRQSEFSRRGDSGRREYFRRGLPGGNGGFSAGEETEPAQEEKRVSGDGGLTGHAPGGARISERASQNSPIDPERRARGRRSQRAGHIGDHGGHLFRSGESPDQGGRAHLLEKNL